MSFWGVFCSRGGDNYFDTIKFDYKEEYRNATKLLYLHSKDKKIGQLLISRDEPANHPFLLNIVRFARKVGFRKIELNTSGIGLADQKFLYRLVQEGITSVVLPVYGITAALHDGIVGMPGALGILRQVMERLKGLKIKTSFRTPRSSRNFMK